jgi:hypothetical protein
MLLFKIITLVSHLFFSLLLAVGLNIQNRPRGGRQLTVPKMCCCSPADAWPCLIIADIKIWPKNCQFKDLFYLFYLKKIKILKQLHRRLVARVGLSETECTEVQRNGQLPAAR